MQGPEDVRKLGTLVVVLDTISHLNGSLRDDAPTAFDAVAIPTMKLSDYVKRLQRYTSFNFTCFLVALTYIDRLCVQSRSFCPTRHNVHRLLVTTLLVASKMVNEVSPTNLFIARCGGIDVCEMNGLEVELCRLLGWKLMPSSRLLQNLQSSLDQNVSFWRAWRNPSATSVGELGAPLEKKAVAAEDRSWEEEWAQSWAKVKRQAEVEAEEWASEWAKVQKLKDSKQVIKADSKADAATAFVRACNPCANIRKRPETAEEAKAVAQAKAHARAEAARRLRGGASGTLPAPKVDGVEPAVAAALVRALGDALATGFATILANEELGSLAALEHLTEGELQELRVTTGITPAQMEQVTRELSWVAQEARVSDTALQLQEAAAGEATKNQTEVTSSGVIGLMSKLLCVSNREGRSEERAPRGSPDRSKSSDRPAPAVN